MTDDELNKVVVAGAFGLAAFHLQNALLTTLVAKGHLTMKEAALTVKGAIVALDEKRPDPSLTDLGEVTKQILTTLEQSWASQARGH